MTLKLLPTFFAFLFFYSFATAQLQTAVFNKSITTSDNINGYWEYLPEGYNTNSIYPLIIYMHGNEGRGNGKTASALDAILEAGLARVIHEGDFPKSFTANGTTFKFIVISPQYDNEPTDADMSQVINYMVQKYKVNTNRIYLTGFSRGGGVVWDYAGSSETNAKKLAAIVPIAGAGNPKVSNAHTIGDADLPVFATHNDGDGIVPVSNTNEYIQLINERSPQPAAKKRIFDSDMHNAWSRTYNAAEEIDNSRNIFEWMLQYQISSGAPLPVLLTDYKAFASGRNEIIINWTTTAEVDNDYFTIERSANGVDFISIATIRGANNANNYTHIDKQPLSGDNYYRLSQTDRDGSVTYFNILKVRLDNLANKGLSFYPNPVKDQLQLVLNSEEKGELTVSVISMKGAVIKQWKLNKENIELKQTLSVSELPAGNYILQVFSKSFKDSKPFIKK